MGPRPSSNAFSSSPRVSVGLFVGGLSIPSRVRGPHCCRVPCARAWGIIHDGVDGDRDLDLAWIPAHTTEAYVPERISAFDKHGNGIGDEHAKLAASEHAISQDMLNAITNQNELVSIVARWIGHAGVILASLVCTTRLVVRQRDGKSGQRQRGERRLHQPAHAASRSWWASLG